MERCNAVSITLGTRCTLQCRINSNYCGTHEKLLNKIHPNEYELFVLEAKQDRQLKELQHVYSEKIKHEKLDTKRKQLQKEIEDTIERLKKEHVWETFKHWLARDERRRRAKGGEFTNI
jgi:hypothetical protein